MADDNGARRGAAARRAAFGRPATRAEIEQFARALTAAYEVVGVQERRGRLTLDPLEDPAHLRLEYPPRVHSPKKFLFPNWEQLFRFRLGETVLLEADRAPVPRVIFGLHPCDLHAVGVLDQCLFEGEADTAYRAKRRASVLIGVECFPDEHCFCTSLGTDRVAEGFDLFVHRGGTDYRIQVGSPKGEVLLRRYAPEVEAREGEPISSQPPKPTARRLRFPVEALAPLLEEGYDHPIWQEIGARCLGCGTCTLLCPSCYCFTVEDRLHLDLGGGERVRTWDSCQFDQFARLSGGAEARADQADRQRHRFFRKYKYLWDRHRRTACVGCGRCSRECLAGIDPVDVLNRLFELRAGRESAAPPGGEYRPRLAEVVEVGPASAADRRLRLRLPEPVEVSPGRFVAVSVFGLGEAPFTVASAPGGGREVELVIREVGSLTRALHRLQPGDTVGVRGPFGTGFPLEEMAGADLLLVAGGLGMVVLRSLLLAVLARRRQFGRVQLLYGAANPEAFLFGEELRSWQRGGELDVRLIVDRSSGGWSGPHGDVTRLLRHLELDPGRTAAAVSGPAGMYRFVNPLLLDLGIAPERLYLNLERHMKCGLGKCGKCRINDLCVCECGPIFSYDRVRHLREAIER
ncbi:MAG: hypothetical protein Kow0092_08290 [Deferrisomatales bacterium]